MVSLTTTRMAESMVELAHVTKLRFKKQTFAVPIKGTDRWLYACLKDRRGVTDVD